MTIIHDTARGRDAILVPNIAYNLDRMAKGLLLLQLVRHHSCLRNLKVCFPTTLELT